MTSFTFQFPSMLLLLPLVIAVAWLMRRAQRCRDEVLLAMGGSSDDSTVAEGSRHSTNRLANRRDWLRLAAMCLLVLALARPGIDPQQKSISKSGRDVVFVLDVSQSMLAEDAYPSRLEAAKSGIRDALDSFGTQRAALVIYAGSANILCPLTFDYDFVRYMLDQASPRSVDFGGTTLLSATEKCADSVFSDDRKGMQDLVVLTDGEDHGPASQRVTDLLRERDAGLLVIGIGDSNVGSRIPVLDEEGAKTYFKHDGELVSTRLNEDGLRQLAATYDDAFYHSVGTSAFDLAGLYAKYADGRPLSDSVGTDTYLVYRELGPLMIGFAVVFLLIAEFSRVRFLFSRRALTSASTAACVLLISLTSVSKLQAQDGTVISSYTKATELQRSGQIADALEAYEEIQSESQNLDMSPEQTAALRFNQGLCHISLASDQVTTEPRSALSSAQLAQRFFLEACQLAPAFRRAAGRLDSTARLIADYEGLVQQENERSEELQEKMQDLIERLKELQDQQATLRDKVPAPPSRNNQRRRGNQPAAAPPVEPSTSAADSRRYSTRQQQLNKTGLSILSTMKDLDRIMTPEVSAGDTAAVSILNEPLRLMIAATSAQQRTTDLLRQWSTWPDGRKNQQVVIAKIEEILDLLAGDNAEDSDEGDWNDEDYDDMMESSESEEAMTSSMQSQGEFASASEMQSLPVPNYSIKDILMEEEGSLQFRQQQRAKNNQNKVKKDW